MHVGFGSEGFSRSPPMNLSWRSAGRTFNVWSARSYWNGWDDGNNSLRVGLTGDWKHEWRL